MMAKDHLLQHEQDHQLKAFELYYSLGSKRSYKKVAGQLGVSPQTVKLWAQSFGWRERVRRRDAEIARKVADQAIQAGVVDLDRNQKIVHMALMKLAKAIAEGHTRMQIADLDRLIRLQAFLEGYSKDRPKPRTLEEMTAYFQQFLSECSTAELQTMMERLESNVEHPEGSPE